MVSAGGGCEAAVSVKTRCVWIKFRVCSVLLYGRRLPLWLNGAVYESCVRPPILYGCEAWCLKESSTIVSSIVGTPNNLFRNGLEAPVDNGVRIANNLVVLSCGMVCLLCEWLLPPFSSLSSHRVREEDISANHSISQKEHAVITTVIL